MTTERIFENATRTKMRFPFKGIISIEDLWDLSSNNLDEIYRTLNAQVKKVNEETLLNVKTREDKVLEDMIEIVKYVFAVKSEEETARLNAKAKREQKQKILSILSNKQEDALQNKSEEELIAMLEELGE